MLSKSLFKKPKLALEKPEGDESSQEGSELLMCGGCRRMFSAKTLLSSLFVCPRCGNYQKVSARRRILMVLDESSFEETNAGLISHDPLDFPGYAEKVRRARLSSGETEAVLTGFGTLDRLPCAFFAMEPSFMMGSMGTAVGEKLTRLFEEATERKLPVIGYTVSGGARMQEGILSLMQMAKVSGAVRRHSDAGNLYIAVLTDPTTGGVAASFAMQADIILAEPGALIGFAGPRVIEQTTRQKLPEGFQRAEFQKDKGFVSRIVPREEQKALLGLLLNMHKREDAYGSL